MSPRLDATVTPATAAGFGSRLRGRGWLLALVLAFGLLGGLALWSDDRQQSLERHEAAGLLRDVEPQQVREVAIARGAEQWRLVRAGAAGGRGGGWRAEPALAAAQPDAIETALRLLRNAAPERVLDAESPAFGFGPQALQLTVHVADVESAKGGSSYRVEFGGPNPIGLARYVRYAHGDERRIVLLPAYVADAWTAIVGGAP